MILDKGGLNIDMDKVNENIRRFKEAQKVADFNREHTKKANAGVRRYKKEHE